MNKIIYIFVFMFSFTAIAMEKDRMTEAELTKLTAQKSPLNKLAMLAAKHRLPAVSNMLLKGSNSPTELLTRSMQAKKNIEKMQKLAEEAALADTDHYSRPKVKAAGESCDRKINEAKIAWLNARKFASFGLSQEAKAASEEALELLMQAKTFYSNQILFNKDGTQVPGAEVEIAANRFIIKTQLSWYFECAHSNWNHHYAGGFKPFTSLLKEADEILDRVQREAKKTQKEIAQVLIEHLTKFKTFSPTDYTFDQGEALDTLKKSVVDFLSTYALAQVIDFDAECFREAAMFYKQCNVSGTDAEKSKFFTKKCSKRLYKWHLEKFKSTYGSDSKKTEEDEEIEFSSCAYYYENLLQIDGKDSNNNKIQSAKNMIDILFELAFSQASSEWNRIVDDKYDGKELEVDVNAAYRLFKKVAHYYKKRLLLEKQASKPADLDAEVLLFKVKTLIEWADLQSRRRARRLQEQKTTSGKGESTLISSPERDSIFLLSTPFYKELLKLQGIAATEEQTEIEKLHYKNLYQWELSDTHSFFKRAVARLNSINEEFDAVFDQHFAQSRHYFVELEKREHPTMTNEEINELALAEFKELKKGYKSAAL